MRPNFRPPVLDAGITILPLSSLSDREFELLIYTLLKEEISQSEHGEFTDIALMQGVGERGRDCVLYCNGCVAGLIQCKKYQKRVTRPDIIRELVKFIMFAILDPDLMPNDQKFNYIMCVSSDFNEPANKLIHSFAEEINKEIISSKISSYIDQLIESYESFGVFTKCPPVSEIYSALRKMRLRSHNAVDLTYRITKKPEILKAFFNLKPIISVEDNERAIKTALSDFAKETGIKYLTDDDLKILQARIGNIPDSKRMNLGWVDLFGYPIDFINRTKDGLLKELLLSLSDLKLKLNKGFIDFIIEEINRNILDKITQKLLICGEVHPFSVQLAFPYLARRNLKKVLKNNLPRELYTEYNPDSVKSSDQVINEIRDYLLNIADNVINGDFSDFSEPSELFEFKVNLAKHCHYGFSTVEEAKAQFEKDIVILKPILDEIDSYINSLMLENPTIVLKDGAFLNDKKELERFAKSLSYLKG